MQQNASLTLDSLNLRSSLGALPRTNVTWTYEYNTAASPAATVHAGRAGHYISLMQSLRSRTTTRPGSLTRCRPSPFTCKPCPRAGGAATLKSFCKTFSSTQTNAMRVPGWAQCSSLKTTSRRASAALLTL